MMRHVAPLVLALGLAACSSETGAPSITGALMERLRPAAPVAEPAKKGPPKRITRAQIEKFDVAMVRANLQGETVAPLMIARAVNQGYATYLSQAGQSITMRGSLVTSTRGLGTDLLSVEHQGNDPLAQPTLPGNWPSSTMRTYYLPGIGLKGAPVVVTCAVKRIKDHDIEVVETPFKTTQMSEFCKTDDGQSFNNHHFVDRATGQIWVTQQWIGPKMAPMALEILEPLG